MNEYHGVVALIILFGILLALARFVQFEKQRRKEFTLAMNYLMPLAAQFEQTLNMLTAAYPTATESVAALADAMQKINYTLEEVTRDSDLNDQRHHLKGSIRVNVIGQTEP
jgi:predicted Co/Zn/Cd cation transporter (cation efflux family)